MDTWNYEMHSSLISKQALMTSFTDIKILLCPFAIYIRPPIGPNGCHPISLALPTVLLMLEKGH